MYERHALSNVEDGNKFELLSEIPAQIVEDYEAGLKEAKTLLIKEIEGIVESISGLFKE
jgi:hypothetical protein